MGQQLVTVAKRQKGKITDSHSFIIETDQPTGNPKEALVKFFLWSMEHDGFNPYEESTERK